MPMKHETTHRPRPPLTVQKHRERIYRIHWWVLSTKPLQAARTLSYRNMQLVVSFYSTVQWLLVVNGCVKTQSLFVLFLFCFHLLLLFLSHGYDFQHGSVVPSASHTSQPDSLIKSEEIITWQPSLSSHHTGTSDYCTLALNLQMFMQNVWETHYTQISGCSLRDRWPYSSLED